MKSRQTSKNAKRKIERQEDEVWDVLEDVIKEHPVLEPGTYVAQTWNSSI